MLYLIDGYNLAHALNLLPPNRGRRTLEVARRSLLVRLCGSQNFEADSVTVVFDAVRAPPGAAAQAHYQGVRVLFSRHEPADDLIEELIQDNPSPRRLTVVSDDRRIQQAARRRDCPVLGCLDYLELLAQPEGPPAPFAPPPPGADDKPEGTSRDELQRWLEVFRDIEDDPTRNGPRREG